MWQRLIRGWQDRTGTIEVGLWRVQSLEGEEKREGMDPIQSHPIQSNKAEAEKEEKKTREEAAMHISEYSKPLLEGAVKVAVVLPHLPHTLLLPRPTRH